MCLTKPHEIFLFFKCQKCDPPKNSALAVYSMLVMFPKDVYYFQRHQRHWIREMIWRVFGTGFLFITHKLILALFHWLLNVTWWQLTEQWSRNSPRLRPSLSSDCFCGREVIELRIFNFSVLLFYMEGNQTRFVKSMIVTLRNCSQVLF